MNKSRSLHQPRPLHPPLITSAFVAAILLLLTASAAFARAGGGGGFHGGGGGGFGGGGGGFHGGGGFGGGGGGGNGNGIVLIIDIIEFLIFHPVIGVPLILIVIVAYLYYANQQPSPASFQGPISQANIDMPVPREQAAIQQIRQHDPAFDESAFAARVRNAFMKIQAAWCAQDLNAVRLFCSDGVAERFALQFSEQRDAGYHDHMESIAVDDVRIADLQCSGVFDEIAVRISASAVDYRATIDGSQRISGSTSAEPFVEMWSFLRRRGALTDPSKPGLIEGNCPNCGGVVAMSESTVCPHCKALLKAGTYDWVLSEITQESEWGRHTGHTIFGLQRLRAQDPGFDTEAMEDRTSVIFWRKAAADRIGKIDPLRKVAAEPFLQEYATILRPPEDGSPRPFIGECAVGSVQMLAFVPADINVPGTEAVERVLVEVHWSGTQYAAIPGQGVRPAGPEVLRSTVLVMGRREGSQTDANKSITSAHCPNCGAPEANDADNACPFCNTVLNDGAHGWVLLGIHGLPDQRTQTLLAAARAAEAG